MTNGVQGIGKSFKGYAYVLGSALLWGMLPIFSALSYKAGSDALTSAAMRSYIASIIFLAWLIFSGGIKKLRLRELPFYLLYGVITGGCTSLCYMTAIERISTAMAAILLYTAPAFVILFNRLIYGEPVTRYKLLAVLCAFGGSFFVVKGYDPGQFASNLAGILIGLASGICYAMTTVMGRKAKLMHDGNINAALMTLFGSLVFIVSKPPWTIGVLSNGSGISAGNAPMLWICYVGLAIFGTVLSYAMYLKGIDNMSDTGMASIIATLEPIAGTLLSVAILGDKLEAAQAIGMVIVVIGISIPVLHELRLSRSHESRASE